MRQFGQGADIVFDEEAHKYYVDGTQMTESVTTVVGQFFSHFDAKRVAPAMLRGWTFWDDEEKYGKYWELCRDLDEDDAVQAIITKWDVDGREASSLGTAMHASIEDYLVKGIELPDTKECRMFAAFHAHAAKLGYVPIESEQIVGDIHASIAGSVDARYYNPTTGHHWLLDWKRSKDIKKEGFRGKKGTGPMSNKDDCNFEKYSLQLNIYKYLLGKNFGVSIERMSIVVLHPDQDTYLLLDVEDNQAAVKKIMDERIAKFSQLT